MGKHFAHLLLFFVLILAGCSSSREMTTTPVETVLEEPVATDPVVAEPDASENEESEPTEAAQAPEDWFLEDGTEGARAGIGIKRTYSELLKDKQPKRKVVVAVIDSGIDIDHEDLKPVLWMNEDEVAGNGTDDDGNGYVDDIHGWNFIGGADGRNVDYDTFEITREYARLRAQFAEADLDALSEEEKEEYAYYEEVQAAYEAEVEEMMGLYTNVGGALELLQAANSIMRDALGKENFTVEEVAAFKSTREDVQQAKSVLQYFDQIGFGEAEIAKEFEKIEGYIEKGLNPDFDPRDIVGDNYDDPSERFYGNNNVEGPDPFHGTHVAGIIAAKRGNGIGIDGVAGHVEIMPIRAVPNGDERDKDVANAIRYAVDNGAHIINMSFGKEWSPHKFVVDDAVRYAESKNVLMVHAAGNDGANNDSTAHFPVPTYEAGMDEAASWIEVGASSWEGPTNLAASFSNYGKVEVDVFAPGVAIYSTVPDNEYDRADGTSMASPVVAGLAAVLMSYYPDFSAKEIKDILMRSAVSYSDQVVLLPGSEETLVSFGNLSRSGAIVNAFEAIKMAEMLSGM